MRKEDDNPNMSEEDFARIFNHMPPKEYRRMVLGDWQVPNAKEFREWLHKTHPDFRLAGWQADIVDKIYLMGRGAGKTTLINLLSEFERRTNEEVC